MSDRTDVLMAELRQLTRSAYLVNEKNPRTYDREWKLHTFLSDGTTFDYVGADSEAGQVDVLRRALRDARRSAVVG